MGRREEVLILDTDSTDVRKDVDPSDVVATMLVRRNALVKVSVR
jgi:hypothetical protein